MTPDQIKSRFLSLDETLLELTRDFNTALDELRAEVRALANQPKPSKTRGGLTVLK